MSRAVQKVIGRLDAHYRVGYGPDRVDGANAALARYVSSRPRIDLRDPHQRAMETILYWKGTGVMAQEVLASMDCPAEGWDGVYDAMMTSMGI